MRKTVQRYYPLFPVFAAYFILFLVGKNVSGMWQLVSTLLFYCALGQAFNIFLGMTGYVDFGYVAFMGVGTYGMAIAITRLAHVEALGVLIVAIGFAMALVMAALLSVAVGAVALRLRGAYFAIATIGVNEGFRFLIEGAKIWNGSDGMIFTAQLNQILGRETASALSTFWADVIVLIIAVLAAFVTLFYMKSKIGYALTALREDEDAAVVMGINVTKYKIIAFITSASFAGLVGATSWALKTPYVFPPEVFEIHYTIEAIIIVLLGGAGTLLGPVAGALIYGISKYYLSIFLPGFQLLIFAPIIIIIIILFPEGVIGMLKKSFRDSTLMRFII
ncbi:MAG: branched-chain amino acid ABC transporter permease [Deltaproteobacteria bacterium]|nr:branched-chain amino acid ABC transporter permease [Deltaproteobacteria bacterium]MBW1918683.1 branched-chain amino acid ABC transporter permease [Deltaproteobacteria bacterium]MBW1935285.1 branched-chain amino acid ABC transporter permease [Deltaproteobacteria bacterium]MBW1978208.1 branched-chain amino acid ABC transporter permease [Deltaproteobacteria bacterium]MBW2044565.1 branched-chain amino acid ABC transporter permease [Deltaproteobacteria bacterium]